MEKLRWTHLGYHFDYNYVNYKEEKYYGFPNDLAELMKCIANGLGFQHYVPETGIINFYPIGSSMGGHTDHYEEELDAPLISVSFGQPAVFLIGGKTKDVKPEALWIRSGDIIIMSGESRVAYHAVPCIIKEGREREPPSELKYEQRIEVNNHLHFKNDSDETDDIAPSCSYPQENGHTSFWKDHSISKEEWEPFTYYLSKTRVNINVRQVHKTTVEQK